MFSLFEKSPLEQLLSRNKSINYKPRIQNYESIKDVSLRDAIIYLERKAEEMELWSGMVNITGLTQTEIEEINIQQKAQIAPYRRAIYELKKINALKQLELNDNPKSSI